MKGKIINYFLKHEDKMQTKTYLNKIRMKGSDPIQSVHRSVRHQSLKLPGHRWTKQCVQAIVNIRCLNLSNNWWLYQNPLEIG